MDQEFTLDQMQPIVYQQLQRSFGHGRLAHAYLFEGEKGTGKTRDGDLVSTTSFLYRDEKRTSLWHM